MDFYSCKTICILGVICILWVLAGSEERRSDFEPFAVMDKTSSVVQGKPAMTFAVPSLLDDYCKWKKNTKPTLFSFKKST